MKLNWKRILGDNISVFELENILKKNKLSWVEKENLKIRIREFREANKKFAEKFLKSDIMQMAVMRTRKETREIQDLKPVEVVVDKELCDRFMPLVIDNLVEIRDKLNAVEHSKDNLDKRWKSERKKNKIYKV